MVKSSPSGIGSRVAAYLLSPVDGASLAAFRVALGAIALLWALRLPAYGWIERDLTGPAFHFAYFGFEWVRPLPGAWTQLEVGVLGVAAVCIALGLWYRLASSLFCVGFGHLFLVERSAYENHLYLLGLAALLLAVAPAHRTLSLDARRRLALRSDVVPAWALVALRAQIALVYAFAGLAKLNADWLQGWPMRLWLPERSGFALIGRFFDEPWFAIAFSASGALFDLAVVPLLVWPRTRDLAFVAAVVFHLTNGVLFDVGLFPPLALAMTALFYPPDAPRRWLGAQAAPASPVPAANGRLALAFLAVFFAVQLAVPLRHLLFPGDASWTEEGHDFAWRMMLRDKEARLRFLATDPDGATAEVDPLRFLTPLQAKEMSVRPDLILQFAHHVGATLGALDVRVEGTVRFNGRPPQPLIDPDANLLAQPRRLGPAPWIVPLRERPALR